MSDLSKTGFDIPNTLPDDIRRIASENRRFIFRMLLKINDDLSYLGHLVTKVAKQEGLIDEAKGKIKGKTIQEWINSWEVSGKNTANAWACQAGVSIIISNDNPLEFESLEEYLTVLYYLNPSSDVKVLLDSKKILDGKIHDRQE
jgi:hypothetical protein